MIKKSYNCLSAKKSGFSLIEVLMSVLIIGLVGGFLLTAMPASFLITKQTENLSKVTDLAQKYIEEVKYELSSNITAYDEAAAGSTPPVPVTADMTNNGYYTVTTSIVNAETAVVNGVTVATLKEINVILKKHDEDDHLIELSTYIKRPE